MSPGMFNGNPSGSPDTYGSLPEADERVLQGARSSSEEKAVYNLLLLLGAGLLFPWNAWIGAADYFEDQYKSYYPQFSFPVAYNLISVPILWYLAKARSSSSHLDYGFHIVLWYFVGGCVLMSVPLLTLAEGEISAGVRFGITAFGVFVTGIGTSMLYGCLFAFFAPMDRLYTQALMSGMGVAGLIVGGLRIITKASVDNLKTSATIYFLISALVMFSCILGFKYVTRTKIVKNRKSVHPHMTASAIRYEAWEVMQHIKWLGGMVFFNFFITLSVFPGLVTKIDSTEGINSWFAVTIVALFQVGDAIGRALPGISWIGPIFNAHTVSPAVSGRMIFYAIFLVAYFVEISDYFTFGMMLLFAITNGFLGSAIMMLAPAEVNTVDEKEIAGTLMTLFLQGGVIAGSCFAWVFIAVI